MTIAPLTTYLRMYRKRSGLTHDEIAFLCGGMSGTSFTRHETAERLPALRTALMYEFILQTSVCELYEGLFHDVRSTVRARVRGLCASLERKPASLERDHKIALLRALLVELPEVRFHAE